MNSLPLRIETPSQIRRKASLEEKLQEIEDAIKVFNKSKVYIHPNETTSSTSSVKGSSEFSADASSSVIRAA
jgi:tRNA(Ser,Leu) C12 N-acetylase TAN1